MSQFGVDRWLNSDSMRETKRWQKKYAESFICIATSQVP